METDTPYRADVATTNVVRFEVTYDGPDVAAGTMDAYALGAAMQSLAEYIDASASLTYGAGASVTHEIEANFEAGSFSFLVLAATPEQVQAGFQLLHYVTSKEFFEILGLTGGGGVIGLIAFLRGRKPKELAASPGNQQVTVTTQDGQTTVVNAQVVNLYNNTIVRERVEGVVAPLLREGITEFRSREVGSETQLLVTQPEVGYFEPPAPEGETLQDKVSSEIIQVVSLNFDQGRKWRFRMADGSTFSSSLDEDFGLRVLRHEVTFGAGDALEADLHSVVTRDAAGPTRVQREIQKVTRHIPAKRLQLPFAFDVKAVPDQAIEADDKDQRRLPPPKGQ